MIQDGNHRFYAAVIRGSKSILSTLSGDLKYARGSSYLTFGVLSSSSRAYGLPDS